MDQRDLRPISPKDVAVQDLAEAREQADAGIRLALPQFAEAVGISYDALKDEESSIDSEWGQIILSWLKDSRSNLFDAMKIANRCCDEMAAVAIGEQINRVDDLMTTLVSRWGL